MFRQVGLAAVLAVTGNQICLAQVSEAEIDAMLAELAGQGSTAWLMVQALSDRGLTVEAATKITVAEMAASSDRSYAVMAGMCLAPDGGEQWDTVGRAGADTAADPSEQARLMGQVIAFEPSQCAMFRPRQQPAGLNFSGGPGIVTPGGTPIEPSPSD